MTLDDIIKLLEHTRKKLGGDTPVCFTSGYMHRGTAKVFDFGEEDREGYCLSITPYETNMYVDRIGRFCFPIREIPIHDLLKIPLNNKTIREQVEKEVKELDLERRIHIQFQTGKKLENIR